MKSLHHDDNFANLIGQFSIRYSETETSPLTKFHVHDAYEATLILSDDVVLDVNNESYSVPYGSLLLFNTMDLHCLRYTGKERYRRWVIWFKQEFLNILDQVIFKLFRCFYVRGFEKSNILTLSKEQCELMCEKYGALKEATLSQTYMREEQVKLLLGEFLIYVNGIYIKRNAINATVKANDYSSFYKSILYIQENFSSKIDCTTLAKRVGLDTRKLCENFKSITGLTTGQFILNFRITAAKNLLIQGYSIAETCEKTGFENWSNFSRTFRSHVGISPKQYAMKYRNG